MLILVGLILVFVGIPFVISFIVILPEILENRQRGVDGWRTLPGGYKQILVTFDDFHKYYTINPDAYKLKTDFDTHPVRDNFIFQFSSYREWKKYQRWLDDGVLLEKNYNNEEAFADIVQSDLDTMQEKHIQWLEARKKEFEEQRKKYLEG